MLTRLGGLIVLTLLPLTIGKSDHTSMEVIQKSFIEAHYCSPNKATTDGAKNPVSVSPVQGCYKPVTIAPTGIPLRKHSSNSRGQSKMGALNFEAMLFIALIALIFVCGN